MTNLERVKAASFLAGMASNAQDAFGRMGQGIKNTAQGVMQKGQTALNDARAGAQGAMGSFYPAVARGITNTTNRMADATSNAFQNMPAMAYGPMDQQIRDWGANTAQQARQGINKGVNNWAMNKAKPHLEAAQGRGPGKPMLGSGIVGAGFGGALRAMNGGM